MESAGNAYTLRSPSTATTPKEKTLLAFLMWRGEFLFEKGNGVFSFGVLFEKIFGQAECKYNSDSVLRNYFAGEMVRKNETDFLKRGIRISAAQEGAGGMRGGFFRIIGETIRMQKFGKIVLLRIE